VFGLRAPPRVGLGWSENCKRSWGDPSLGAQSSDRRAEELREGEAVDAYRRLGLLAA